MHTVPRIPSRSEGQATGETSAQSIPAMLVPGVGTAVGAPAASEAVTQSAVSGSTAITALPASAP